MKKKYTLAFEQLEAEMELICEEEMANFKGDDGTTGLEWGIDSCGIQGAIGICLFFGGPVTVVGGGYSIDRVGII